MKKKAELDGIALPDDVAIYLATNIKSNVRELEGAAASAWRRFAGLQEQPITIDFAKETLKNFLTQAAHSLTVEAVQKEVASYFNVKLADLRARSATRRSRGRAQIAMYLARKLCKASYPELGAALRRQGPHDRAVGLPEDRSSWSRPTPRRGTRSKSSSATVAVIACLSSETSCARFCPCRLWMQPVGERLWVRVKNSTCGICGPLRKQDAHVQTHRTFASNITVDGSSYPHFHRH